MISYPELRLDNQIYFLRIQVIMPFFLYMKQIFNPEKILRYILFACIPAFLFYSFSLLGLSSLGFEIMEIIRDPAQQTGQSSFLGFLSNIGIWLWISSATICFFSISTYTFIVNDKHKELLFLVGMMSIMLAIDDFFMIHDRYINQNICYLAYAFIATALFVRHYKKIIEIDGFSFLLAGLLLALSILIDLIQNFIPLKYAYTQIFEEGFKFIGAATWLYFSWRIASLLMVKVNRKNNESK
jgi:hypothetical protein